MKIKLGDLCIIQAGGTPSRSNNQYWENGGIPWVKIGDINSKYLNKTTEFITAEGLKNSSAKLVSKGSILYTIFATLGELCITNINVTTNQAIAGITLKDDKVDLDYLYYYLKSRSVHVNSIGRGVAQNNINLSILREFEIPIPEKNNQFKIANTLSVIEKMIDNKKLLLSKYDQLIKSRFVEIFGDVSQKENGFTLNDVCLKMVRGPFGSSLKKEYFVPEGSTTYKVYEQKHAINREVNIGDYYIDSQKFEKLKRFEVKPGDVIMSCSGTIGKFFVIPTNAKPGIINQALLNFKLNESLINNEYFLQSMYSIISTIESKGSGIANITSVNNIKKTNLFLPALTEQNKFTDFVQQVDKLKFEVSKLYNKHNKIDKPYQSFG